MMAISASQYKRTCADSRNRQVGAGYWRSLPAGPAILRGDPAGLTRAALEALILEGLRAGKLTEAQARRMLGFTPRFEMDGFLKAHEMLLPLTSEDVERDAVAALAYRNP